MKMKRWAMWFLLAVLAVCLCGCSQNPSEEQLFAKLIAHFESYGYSCALSPLADSQPDRAVPIYKASAWHQLMLDAEEVLVYFDESNRADYLSGFVDEERYGRVERFGLRFVLVYAGEDPAVHEALDAMDSI